jgi:hypothetical protein
MSPAIPVFLPFPANFVLLTTLSEEVIRTPFPVIPIFSVRNIVNQHSEETFPRHRIGKFISSVFNRKLDRYHVKTSQRRKSLN